MAASRLCDFCEILACWRWVWLGVLSEFAKINLNGKSFLMLDILRVTSFLFNMAVSAFNRSKDSL